ncbi:MAG: metallophosphoesterase [Verrucomicrobia bacterium]|nr:metallophosphoesterase [Verrucomicrobiota bacterium]MCH8511095.1 metallophosphoesterase [Kiritimatiellia bacterium]
MTTDPNAVPQSDATHDHLLAKGLRRPLHLYYFADTHLQQVSANDPLLPNAWRENPAPELPCSNSTLLASHLDRAVAGGADIILCGGDLFHFPSAENVELALRLFGACPRPVWSVPGNHDWFYPGQDGWEDLRERMLPRLEKIYRGQAPYWSRSVQGLRVIGLDNSTYYLNAEQVSFLERELAEDVPTVVMMHIPLSTPALREATVAKHGQAILMADPSGRKRPGIDPEPTRRAAALLRVSPRVLAVLSAHVHFPFQEDIAPGKPQLIPDAGYRHGYRWILVE